MTDQPTTPRTAADPPCGVCGLPRHHPYAHALHDYIAKHPVCPDPSAHEAEAADAEWIAAADPQRILALLDNLSAALAREDKYRLEADRLVRRVAALEEGLRDVLRLTHDWAMRHPDIDKARALGEEVLPDEGL